MHLKEDGTVLISTMVILALMSTLGFCIFQMMRNNNELSSVYEFNKDIYDFDKNEEETLFMSMEELNKTYKEKLLNGEDTSIESLLSNDIKIDNSILSYDKENSRVILISKDGNSISKKREILYMLQDERIILVPTYKFGVSDE